MYVKQPHGFEDSIHLDYVLKLNNSLYELKQAPRTYYKRLTNFLLENGFEKEKIYITLLKKTLSKEIFIVQVYVDDIIFGSTNASPRQEFYKIMHAEFEMSVRPQF